MLVVLNTVWNGMWLYTDDSLISRTVQWIYHCIKFTGQLFICLMFVNHLRYRHCCKNILILWISNIIACDDNIIFFYVWVMFFWGIRWDFFLLLTEFLQIYPESFMFSGKKKLQQTHPLKLCVIYHRFYDFRHNFIMLGQSYLYAILMRWW